MQQNGDQYRLVKKLPLPKDRNFWKEYGTVPVTHMGQEFTLAPTNQTGTLIVYGTLGRILRKVLPQ